MTYFYKEITTTIRRPIIQIIVKTETNFVIYPVLIDSGADYCIFSTELAVDLGIKLQEKKVKFKGVGKDQIIGRWGEVELRFSEYSYRSKALFAEISDFGHGILGQLGFFDHFDVKLSYKKQTIEINLVES